MVIHLRNPERKEAESAYLGVLEFIKNISDNPDKKQSIFPDLEKMMISKLRGECDDLQDLEYGSDLDEDYEPSGNEMAKIQEEHNEFIDNQIDKIRLVVHNLINIILPSSKEIRYFILERYYLTTDDYFDDELSYMSNYSGKYAHTHLLDAIFPTNQLLKFLSDTKQLVYAQNEFDDLDLKILAIISHIYIEKAEKTKDSGLYSEVIDIWKRTKERSSQSKNEGVWDHYNLIKFFYSIALSKKGKPFKSLRILNWLRENNKENEYLYCDKMGDIFYLMAKWDEALKSYNEANAIAYSPNQIKEPIKYYLARRINSRKKELVQVHLNDIDKLEDEIDKFEKIIRKKIDGHLRRTIGDDYFENLVSEIKQKKSDPKYNENSDRGKLEKQILDIDSKSIDSFLKDRGYNLDSSLICPLDYFTIKNYQTIIQLYWDDKKANFKVPFNDSNKRLSSEFDAILSFRNSVKHHNPVNKIVMNHARVALEYFNEVLSNIQDFDMEED